jgi:hypothetical protein
MQLKRRHGELSPQGKGNGLISMNLPIQGKEVMQGKQIFCISPKGCKRKTRLKEEMS